MKSFAIACEFPIETAYRIIDLYFGKGYFNPKDYSNLEDIFGIFKIILNKFNNDFNYLGEKFNFIKIFNCTLDDDINQNIHDYLKNKIENYLKIKNF